MLKKYFNFHSPDGESGAAASTANTDDLFETVEGSDAGSEERLIDGVKAVNTRDTEGNSLNAAAGDDDGLDDEAAFEELINGKYKDVYQKKINGVIGKRFKSIKKTEEELASLKSERESFQPLFNAMAAKYGIDPKDVKAIVEAASEDNSNFEDEAFKHGFSNAEAYRNHLNQAAELERLRDADRQRTQLQEQNEQRDQLMRGWLNEAKELKAIVPEFDLKAEIQNDRFSYFLNSGFSVSDAYKMTHVDEYAAAKAAAAAKEAEARTLNELRANRARPTESAAVSSASVRVKKSVSNLTLADTDRLIEEAKRGKKITL
ncbi:MAG: hypothetical protein IJY88_02190 [Clostridia bacterium]|nr:hypothetical protein [Clostridia bacterium]